jgi:hypothetical protein
MNIGDLVRTMGNTSQDLVMGIIDGEDPRSLHGHGWWIFLSTGERVSRHPGDIEVIS